MEDTTKSIVTLEGMAHRKEFLFFLHAAFKSPEECVWFFPVDEVYEV